MEDIGSFVPDPDEDRMTTGKFITAYCQHYSEQNPRPYITNKTWIQSLWDKLQYNYELVDGIEIREYLKRRSESKKTYRKFYLTTLWWHVIKHKVLMRDGWSCRGENCTTPDCKTLHVHHKNYDHKGEEINYLEDLITLCEVCHEKEHPEKRKKRIFKKRRDVLELEAEAVMNGFEDKVEHLRKADAENKAKQAEKDVVEKRVYSYDDMSDAELFADVLMMLDEVIETLNN